MIPSRKNKSIYISFALVILFVIYTIVQIQRRLITINDKDPNFDIVLNKFVRNEQDIVNNELLQIEIDRLKDKLYLLETKLNSCAYENIKTDRDTNKKEIIFDDAKQNELILAQIQHKYLSNEGDIYVYSAFTLDKLYPAESDPYQRNILKLTGFRESDLKSIVQTGVDNFNLGNANKKSGNYSLKNFLIGFYRSTPIDGYEYELYFKDNDAICCTLIKINRPLREAHVSISTQASKSDIKKIIHFILPLSSLISSRNKNAFKLFLSSFETVALNQDGGFAYLIIVYSYTDQEDKRYLEEYLDDFKKRTYFQNVKLITIQESKEEFSRAKLLKLGIDNCCSRYSNTDEYTDDLVFFCDVDVLFNRNFLEICRTNAVRNKRVFFPILYSFYNPSLLKLDESLKNSDEEMINHEDESSAKVNLIINKETGYWRSAGFGMACLHKSDFNSIKGFGDYIRVNGWGGEDLYLYRKFLKTNLEIFRSITPGLFHMYHSKQCDPSKLTNKQYKNCVYAKIQNEASQKNFGLYYFNLTQNSKH